MVVSVNQVEYITGKLVDGSVVDYKNVVNSFEFEDFDLLFDIFTYYTVDMNNELCYLECGVYDFSDNLKDIIKKSNEISDNDLKNIRAFIDYFNCGNDVICCEVI